MTVVLQRATNAQYFSLFTSQAVAPSLLRAAATAVSHHRHGPAQCRLEGRGGLERAGGLRGRVNTETRGGGVWSESQYKYKYRY